MTTSGPSGVFGRAHRLTTAGLLVLVTFVAFESMAMPSVGVLLLDRSPEHRRGADSAAFQISDVTGSALCVGVVGVLIAASTAAVLSLSAAVLVPAAVLTALSVHGAVVAPRAGGPASTRGAQRCATTLAAS